MQKDMPTPTTRLLSAALELTVRDSCAAGHTVCAAGRGVAFSCRQPRAKQLFSAYSAIS